MNSDLERALSLACSSDVTEVKQGEQLLSLLGQKPNFHLGLTQIVVGQNLTAPSGPGDTFNVRWMAAMTLKNGVDKLWRRNFSDEGDKDRVVEEQSQIKTLLLDEQLMREPDLRIGLSVAVTVSKIARFDCPEKWPNLLPILIQNVEASLHSEQANNALLVLYHVTKVLSLKRLPADRAAFRSLSTEAFPIFKQLCAAKFQLFISYFNQKTTENQASPVNTDLEKRVISDLLLTFKMMKKLLIHGFSKVRELPQVSEFVHVVLSEYLPAVVKVSLVFRSTHKIPECLWKLLYEFVYNDPMSFACFVGDTLKLLQQILFVDTSNISKFSDRFVLKAVNLFKIILLCEEFQPRETLIHLEHPLTLEARQKIDEIMNADSLAFCVQVCIEHYLPISCAQLESWNEDPETFFIESETGGDSWQTNSTACIASFFVTLIKQNAPLTSKVVLDAYSSVIGQYSSHGVSQGSGLGVPQDSRTILAFDAVLNAFGLALYDICAQITLNEDLLQVLENFVYAEKVIEDMKILRKRVCAFLCCWIDAGFPEHLLERLIKLLLYEFNNEQDAVVLLTATKTLHTLFDTIDIPQESVTNYSAFFISKLHSLISNLEQSDSKAKVLNTLSLVIDRTRFDLVPYASDILSLMQNLWSCSEASDLQFLRSSVLDCMCFVVSGLKEKCDITFAFVKHIESVCLNQENEQSMNLMLDGLNLLLMFVQNTEDSGNGDLLAMLPAVLPCLELGSEVVQVALPIISSISLLFTTRVYVLFGDLVNASLLSLHRESSRESMVFLVQSITVFFRCSLIADLSVISTEPFFELSRTLLQEVLDQDCTSLVEADLIAIFSRLMLEKPAVFVAIISSYARECQITPESVLSRLIGIICDCIDDIVDVRTRKLTALALIYVMNPENTSLDLVKERFAEVFYVCLGCMHDLVDPVTANPDMLIARSPKVIMLGEEQSTDGIETAHDKREQSLNQSCITSHVALKDELRNLLSLLRNNPNANFEHLMASIDESCKIELEKFYE